MFNRRDFIIKAAAATGGIAMGLRVMAEKHINKSEPKGSPLVIATWENLGGTEAGWKKILNGGSALDAVEACACVPEADPENTSVGLGGLPDRDGYVTLDACIMDHLGNAGSVTYLQHIVHPTSVARRVMEKTPHVMLSGDGALQFALSEGFKKENLLTDKAKRKWEDWKKEAKYEPIVNIERHDTIGILAIGADGKLAGACSTSGLAFKMHGRVGDSPIIGAGLFVDDEVGGACATGVGELVMKTLGSFFIVELMRQGKSPQQACEEAVHRITNKYEHQKSQVAFLAVNKNGEVGAYAIHKGFNYSLFHAGENKLIEANSLLHTTF